MPAFQLLTVQQQTFAESRTLRVSLGHNSQSHIRRQRPWAPMGYSGQEARHVPLGSLLGRCHPVLTSCAHQAYKCLLDSSLINTCTPVPDLPSSKDTLLHKDSEAWVSFYMHAICLSLSIKIKGVFSPGFQ